jgi:hypothetical protein
MTYIVDSSRTNNNDAIIMKCRLGQAPGSNDTVTCAVVFLLRNLMEALEDCKAGIFNHLVCRTAYINDEFNPTWNFGLTLGIIGYYTNDSNSQPC